MRRAAGWVAAMAAGFICGCGGGSGREVVVYAALDREFSEPVLQSYEKTTGVAVRAVYDVESTKSVGLRNRLIAEANRPRCDVFWNNEILNTMRLAEAGLLQPFVPPHADLVPAPFKAKDGTWYGFAARARILLVNTELVAEADRPRSIEDLTDPRWKGKFALAKPLFGTTATHAACLFSAWGDERATAYFRALKANGALVLSGNKQVAMAVGQGEVAIGMTDTDDALAELEQGRPVAVIYPDREPGELGTLFLPNTLAMIAGGPHSEEAEALAGHLLSPEVEQVLAAGPSAQIPLLGTVGPAAARVETPATVHPMTVDFADAARRWDSVAAFLAAEFAASE